MTFDWSFVQRYAPFFVNGTLMTLFISVFGILLAIAVGLVCAGVEIARIPVARQIVRIYIELSRNTPLLVQLYFLYFGLPKLGVVWSAETCAIVGLGFLGGSYMAEAMRGGLEAVPNVQRETAYVLGLTSTQTITRMSGASLSKMAKLSVKVTINARVSRMPRYTRCAWPAKKPKAQRRMSHSNPVAIMVVRHRVVMH